MKKNLLFVLGLVAMLVMVAGCGDDEEDEANYVADMCAKVFECKDTIGLEEEVFTASYGADAAACEAKYAPAATEEPAEGEEAAEETAEPDMSCYEACLEGTCEDLLTCMGACGGTTDDDDDDVTTDDDDDDDEPVCIDDDGCEGWAVCGTDENDVAACLNECAAEYVAGTHGNEDCQGASEFVTARYGDCVDVPCTTNEDCAGLGACDKDEASTKTFSCLDTGLCKRD